MDNNQIENKSSAKKIYVDLDSLFDTRLSVLESIDSKLALAIYSNRAFYDTRLIDEFDYISKDVFKKYYSLRNNKDLFSAVPTNILELILADIMYIAENRHITDENSPITILIDLGKYNLKDKDVNNLLYYIREMIKLPFIKIDIVKDGFYNKSPSYINDHIFSIYKYDGIEWLNNYINLWNPSELQVNMPNTKLVVPALFDRPMVFKKVSDYITVLEDTAKYLKPVIDISYVDVVYYNYVTKKKK